MSKYYIRGAKLTDPLETAHKLRKADLEEMAALGHNDPVETLMASIAHSQVAVVDTVDDSPECYAGVTKEGVIWCVTTQDYIDNHQKRFVKVSKEFIKEVQDVYPVLWNHVYFKNIKHIKWLDAMGFILEDPKPYGLYGLPFLKFTRSKNHV